MREASMTIRALKRPKGLAIRNGRLGNCDD